MPSREYHRGFDALLRKKRVICEDTDGESVHRRMDKGSKWFQEAHRDLDHFHSDAGIRDYVTQLIESLGSIYTSTATDNVRIAYGHLCLDYIASKLKRQQNCTYRELDWNLVYRRAWNLFKRKGYKRKYYKYD